jgi:hypothetical protein
MTSIILLIVILPNVVFLNCYAKCYYDCRNAECHYAEGQYTECHYTKSHGAVNDCHKKCIKSSLDLS